MIKVLFFAQLRELLNCSQTDFPAEVPLTVAGLRRQLACKGGNWQKVFTDPQVLIAVNQVMGNDDTIIADGDEVAFFPPVTGG